MYVNQKIYNILCVLFSLLLVIGNLTYQKFIILKIPFVHTFEISVGAILYPLLFLISDLIAEFFGKAHAKFCLKLAIMMNVVIALIIGLMDYLPATDWSRINNETFHQVFGVFGIAFIGSMLACYVSQTIDIGLYLTIKRLTGDRWIWMRNNLSTAISLLIDTITVLSFLAFFNICPKEHLLDLIVNSYLWKLFFSISSTPIFYLMIGIIRYFRTDNTWEYQIS